MGVKDLWTVLEPVSEHCTMADLRGKVLAVDISGWIFQSLQSPVMHKKQAMRPHVRNLFWRLHHLMRNEVRIIVVFDGPSPKLKSVALAKRAVARRQQREKGQPEEEPPLDNIPIEPKPFRPMNVASETYFGQYCNECKELLRAFRIPYIVSSGDAEATCAYLNRLGLVDGCITDDNDAFLFGAAVVYRHYTCDKKKLENMKCYRSYEIEEQLGLTQDHLIAMALILGCDYGLVGIKGIGKERALEVMQSWPGCNPLQKMRDWRQDKSLETLARFDPNVKPEHCKLCGHVGNTSDHRTDGCNGCARLGRACARIPFEEWTCNCEWHKEHVLFKKRQTEIKIRKAAIEDSSFPDKDIIDTYKQEEPDEHPGSFVWTRPYFSEVQKFVSRLFGWNKDKAREKLLTYFTSYDLMALKSKMSQYELSSLPEKIICKRVEHGREMYEVQWKSIPDFPRAEGECPANEHVTREFKDLFDEVFPELVEQYEESKAAAKKGNKKSSNLEVPDDGDNKGTPKRRRRKKAEVQEHADNSDAEGTMGDGLQIKEKRGRKKKTDIHEKVEGSQKEDAHLEDKAKTKPKKRRNKRGCPNESDEDGPVEGFLAKTIGLMKHCAVHEEALGRDEKNVDNIEPADSLGEEMVANTSAHCPESTPVEAQSENDNIKKPSKRKPKSAAKSDDCVESETNKYKTPQRKRTAGQNGESVELDLEILDVCKTPRKKKRIIEPVHQETPLVSDQQLTVECFFLPVRRTLNFEDDTNSGKCYGGNVNDSSQSLAEPICISDDESDRQMSVTVGEARSEMGSAQSLSKNMSTAESNLNESISTELNGPFKDCPLGDENVVTSNSLHHVQLNLQSLHPSNEISSIPYEGYPACHAVTDNDCCVISDNSCNGYEQL